MNRRTAANLIAPLFVAGVVVGCGNSYTVNATASREEASVKGVVRVRGKAVNNGRISFRGSNVNRVDVPLKEAEIGKDGTYTIKPLVGQNFVEVSCKEIFTKQNRALVENERMVEVKSGEQTIDIDIPEMAPTEAK